MVEYIASLQSRLSQAGFFLACTQDKRKSRTGESIMKKLVGSLVLTLVVGFTGIAQVHALDFGEEITVSDRATGSGWNDTYEAWWNTEHEDQEVEANCVADQVWDMEGFALNGTELTMIAGYDFINGEQDIHSGDIFIDVDGDVVFGEDMDSRSGNGNKTIDNVFGYDYVLDLDFDNLTYDVFQIDSSAELTTPYYRQNDTSGAWKYESGGTYVTSGTIDYVEFTDAATDYLGDWHNAATVDLGFIGQSTDFTAHFTMGCGNDDLIGQGHLDAPVPTPEPGTLFLLGVGLLGLIGIAKKRLA
jgi:hypothetical protein